MATFIYPLTPVTVNASNLAQEATLQQVETNTANTVTELQSANTELQDINTELNTQSTTLSSIDSKVLTDAQLRASPVPVSGPLTDAELRASAVPVSAASLPLPTGAATETTLAALNARVAGSLVPEEFDEQVISYVLAGNGAGEVFQIVYKLATVTVATVTLSYDSSNRVIGVVRS